MSKKILINLPVSDPQASKAFFVALGLAFNETLSDEHATCFNIEENIIVALLPAEHFKDTLMGNDAAAPTTNETVLAIGMESKEDVDALLDKAVAAGGTELHDRVDMPGIYAGTFKDLDGHFWNVFYMS
ncbi:MAG: VOC family protein [Candidatus Saccharimonadales bacterium]